MKDTWPEAVNDALEREIEEAAGEYAGTSDASWAFRAGAIWMQVRNDAELERLKAENAKLLQRLHALYTEEKR